MDNKKEEVDDVLKIQAIRQKNIHGFSKELDDLMKKWNCDIVPIVSIEGSKTESKLKIVSTI